ncbi:hypothetical protein ACP70R_018149 [Stipagrostis hirtigluma subsp. patula]
MYYHAAGSEDCGRTNGGKAEPPAAAASHQAEKSNGKLPMEGGAPVKDKLPKAATSAEGFSKGVARVKLLPLTGATPARSRHSRAACRGRRCRHALAVSPCRSSALAVSPSVAPAFPSLPTAAAHLRSCAAAATLFPISDLAEEGDQRKGIVAGGA